MRLDVVTEGPLEALASALGLVPEGLVRVVWGFTQARAIVAAVELGLPAALAEGPLPVAALAARLGADEEALRALCIALSGFGLLHRQGEVFSLRAEALAHLTPARGRDLSAAVRLGALLDDRLGDLAERVRSGRRGGFHEGLGEAEWEVYLRGLHGLSGVVAEEVARRAALPRGASRLLDVGGGHGGFSMAFARRHPGLACEVLDLPGGCRVGRSLVAEAGLSERVRHREGDLREADWGEGWSGVLLFNVLHNLGEDEARAAVAAALRALAPGGALHILEGQRSGREGDASFQEAFGELLFFVLSDARTWPEPAMRAWMQEAGFTALRRRSLLTLPGAVLLSGRRPA